MTDRATAQAETSSQVVEPATMTVLTRIRELIVTGEVAAGSRLKAEVLANQVGVSRTPVRSALAVLAAEGLVSYSVNKGYTVKDITLRDIFDAIEARAVLESRACSMSVDYGWSAAELSELQGYVQLGASILSAGNWSEEQEKKWYQMNRDLHALVINVSRNAAIRNAVRMTLIYPIFGDIARLSPVVSQHVPQRLRVLTAEPPQYIADMHAEHRQILQAIEEEDAQVASEAMLDHILSEKYRLAKIATRL